MTRVLPFRSSQGLQPERILGITFALLAHTALFMVLMRPPELATPREETPPREITIIDARIPPPPPVQHPIDRPHTQQQPRIVQQPTEPHPVITQQPTPISIPADPQPVAQVDGQLTVNPQPVESSLSPIVAPAPTYPRGPLTEGITGTVELELLVGVDGRVLEARVVRSSGNRQLDSAARDTVLRQWRFQPATHDGVPVQALGRLPVVFSLDGR
jgi:protein TonB